MDKTIYERIFKKDMDNYQDLNGFNPFNKMGAFLKSQVLTVKNAEGQTNQQLQGG